MKKTFEAFMADANAWDMYVTGRAGTGKTTKLAEVVDGLENCTVCAYTHKACDILREKLPKGTRIQTLHSFLKKRPTVNSNATKVTHVTGNAVMGESDRVHVMFIDEYSMIGEQDLMDIRALQDEDYDGTPGCKVVWIGDPHQLPPVGDMYTLRASGDYQVILTKVYRQASDNPLLKVLDEIISFIEGKPAHPLTESSHFIRGIDICNPALARPFDSVYLAYTNRRVQEVNAILEGMEEPVEDSIMFSPTTKRNYVFESANDPCVALAGITLPFGDRELLPNSKYKTLEYLITMPGISFANVTDDNDEVVSIAYVFGHESFKQTLKELKYEAAASNKAIEMCNPGYKAANWAKENYSHPLARGRAKAWRDFLTFNDCVMCLDFDHAMTVHKSQGQTYDTVYLDTIDIGLAANRDYMTYLKLMNVGISRASNKVYTN